MAINTFYTNILPSKPIAGGWSRTARNFKGSFPSNALPRAVSVSLDWFSLMVESGIVEPKENETVRDLGNECMLVPLGMGTQMFEHVWQWYWHGEHCANILTHGRGVIKPNTAKIELLNHVLYSSEWMDVLAAVIDSCKFPAIRNISRIDIAIDGANHVPKFLNSWIGEITFNPNYRIQMKGKARINPGMLNVKTGMYEAFRIGRGKKYVTIYNKTQEINTRSHKEYIRETWERAGLDLNTDNWRVELRMNSESIKQIDQLDIKRLNDPNYLLQIFKTQIENFFQFVDMRGQTNISYGTVIDLFQFEKLKVPLLHKIPRKVVDGAYKAKMAIHNAVKDVIQVYSSHMGTIKKGGYNAQAALQHIRDSISLYSLQDWYNKRIEKWNDKYKTLFAPEWEKTNKILLQLAN